MDELGMPPKYVFRETIRCVAGVNGKTSVYSGVGFDIPWHLPEGDIAPRPSDPEIVYKSTSATFEAGAHGVVASRVMMKCKCRVLRHLENAVRNWKEK
jgi:hypothetical protein